MMCKRFKGRTLLDEPDSWYSQENKPLMWAYAGGGGRRYGNAVEDVVVSIEAGFKVVELDFARTSDGVPAATHFFKPENSETEWDHVPSASEFMSKKVNGRFSPMLFRDVIDRFIGKGVYFSLDPFYWYCNVENGETLFREYVVANTTADERKKLILQLYSFKALCQMRGNNDFGALHYIIGPGTLWKVPHLVHVLTDVGVHSVSMQDAELTTEMREAISILRKAGTHVSIAGVNTLERYREVLAAGADCINTSFLTPREVAR